MKRRLFVATGAGLLAGGALLGTRAFAKGETMGRREYGVDITKTLAQCKDVVESWNLSGVKVLHVVLQSIAPGEFTLGHVQAAFGLGLAFCYKRGDWGPPSMCNVGLAERVAADTGCVLETVWPTDHEEAWRFIREGLQAGYPVKIPGPEDSIAFSVTESDVREERRIMAKGVGGPSFDGDNTWKAFTEHIGWAYHPPMGIYRHMGKKGTKPDPVDYVKAVAQRMVDWQTDHPDRAWESVGPGTPAHSKSFGISAFENYYNDLLDDSVDKTGNQGSYIECWAIRCQIDARKGLGTHFIQLAKNLPTAMAKKVRKVGDAYVLAAEKMDSLVASKVDTMTSEGKAMVKVTVGVALEQEKMVLGLMEQIATNR